MSEHAWIQLPFAKLGVSAELGSSLLSAPAAGFPDGPKRCCSYSERIDAQQAVQLQLANKVLPHNELLAYTREQALKLIPPNGAGMAIREMKKLLHEPQVAAISDALDRENIALQQAVCVLRTLPRGSRRALSAGRRFLQEADKLRYGVLLQLATVAGPIST